MSSGSERGPAGRRRIRHALLAALLLPAGVLTAYGIGRPAAHASTAPVHLSVPGADAAPAPPDRSSDAVLRVCADPNNLPFSNDAGEGFENQLARLVAAELHRSLQYYWWPQRRGFVRNTLNAGHCDLIVGVPARTEMARTTRPYYRSSYVFVSRRGLRPVRSFDDARLRHLRIGVQMTGEDYENPPALQALAGRHIVDNVRPFLVYGDYSKPRPLAAPIDAVRHGDVDVAIAWGPTASFFAGASAPRLAIEPVAASEADPALPFTFAIAMAVRRADAGLQAAVDDVLVRRRTEVVRILSRYGVPQLPLPAEERGE